MASREFNLAKNKNNDRIIVLAPIEGQTVLSGLGQNDSRLFTGENKLHGVMDEQTSLWSLHFEHGIVPGSFKQQFTTFNKLLDFVKTYYEKRNVQVVEVID